MSFGQMHTAPAIPDFAARYPELAIDMRMTDHFVDVIEEGYDLAIRVAKLADSSLIARKLAPCRVIACAAPSYLDTHGTPRTPADLTDHNCLNYTLLTTQDEWRFDGANGPTAARVRGNFQADNGEALRDALIAGLGVGHLPSFIVGADIQSGRLRAILTDFESAERSVYAVYPHNRHLSPKVRAFLDYFAERFAPTPYWDTPGADPR